MQHLFKKGSPLVVLPRENKCFEFIRVQQDTNMAETYTPSLYDILKYIQPNACVIMNCDGWFDATNEIDLADFNMLDFQFKDKKRLIVHECEQGLYFSFGDAHLVCRISWRPEEIATLLHIAEMDAQ